MHISWASGLSRSFSCLDVIPDLEGALDSLRYYEVAIAKLVAQAVSAQNTARG